MSKYIFITGGVISGIGKGVYAASIGCLLKAKGFKIFMQKFDPYLNVDPGTLSPYEHGEVYVTNDGAETDLDLGHYERFTNENTSKESNYTTGQIYKQIIAKERKGFYKGKTVQLIPHMSQEIINLIKSKSKKTKLDFVITEIGGTIGDIESLVFIRALATLAINEPQNCYFVHITFVPYLDILQQFKTKPTQSSISTLGALSIKPNMLLLRSKKKVSNQIKMKVARNTFIAKTNIIVAPDQKNIYEIPFNLEEQNVTQKILQHFKLENPFANLSDWEKYLQQTKAKKKYTAKIAMIGKYLAVLNSYISIIEAIKISANYHFTKIEFEWIDAEKITKKNLAKLFNGIDGVIILPGFGTRGFKGKITAATYLRDHNIPTLGICYGMQAMVIEQALRQKIPNPASSEISRKGTFIIDKIQKKQKTILGATLRLGASKIILRENSIVAKIYGKKFVYERHRHRYEINNKYLKLLQTNHFVFSGFDAKTNLVEICEVKDKKFFIGVQYHPEFTARPLKPNLIFNHFLKVIIQK